MVTADREVLILTLPPHEKIMAKAGTRIKTRASFTSNLVPRRAK
jgi:hypothetical protein